MYWARDEVPPPPHREIETTWYVAMLHANNFMYRIDYTKEWVMRLCNPRVCGYPEAKPRDKCKQVGYSA